jgi:hypothetical protein
MALCADLNYEKEFDVETKSVDYATIDEIVAYLAGQRGPNHRPACVMSFQQVTGQVRTLFPMS